MVIGFTAGISLGRAQTATAVLSGPASDPNHTVGVLPVFSEKDSVKGSPYLVKGWLMGTLELSSHERLPESGHSLFFNYDKMNERLFATDGEKKPWFYSIDSIKAFTLIDTDAVYEFEKVPLISPSHLFRVLVKSDSGYSLYKRMTSKFVPSDYVDQVYWTTGKKFDMYIDRAEYYLVYPGHSRSRKLNLNVREIKKSLPSESGRLNKFFGQDSGPVDEQAFVVLLKNLNGQISPSAN